MILPVGELQIDIPAGAHGDRALFERDGCAVGRGVFSPEVLRELRRPLIEALVADRYVELVEGHEDRLRWIGDAAAFNRHDYERWIKEGVEDMLLKTGVAAAATKAIWGTRAAIWDGIQLFSSIPGTPRREDDWRHRDATPLTASAEIGGQVRSWVPLTELGDGDGSLALAAGSHLIPDQPADAPPMPHVLHPDLFVINNNLPPEELLAPLWRTARMEIGDAIVFRSDVVHSAARNHGSYLRLSVVLTAQDARVPLGYAAGLSLDSARALTDVEWVILALLAVQPTSRWRARCASYSRGIVGRTWTEQPSDRVERTFTTLQARGLIEPHETHSDGKWPVHHFFHATARGRSDVTDWLTTPSASEPRLLTLKQLLCDWLGLDTTALLAAGPKGLRDHRPEPLPAT